VLDGVFVEVGVLLFHHEGAQPVTPFFVFDAERGGFDHVRVPADQVFDLGGEDVFASGHDHLVVAAADVKQPVLVEVADITR
jgi:hypothetical protein